MSVWFTVKDIPKEGSQIRYIMSPSEIEDDVWLNGKLSLSPKNWKRVKLWKYNDKNYLENLERK